MGKRFKTVGMSTKQLEDIAKLRHPNVYRNNRGAVRIGGGYVRYGIPEPKRGEKDTDLKGGDFIGYEIIKITPDMVGKYIPVFCNIEVKGIRDRIKEGQVRYHNLIIDRGGISKIYLADGRIITRKTTIEEVNNAN
jgi:hypothetical protein